VGVVVVVDGNPNLLEIVFALHAPSRFPGLLNGREQNRHEDGDDRDDDQEFDEREASATNRNGHD
jgi:hypothetical protein